MIEDKLNLPHEIARPASLNRLETKADVIARELREELAYYMQDKFAGTSNISLVKVK